MMRVVHVMGRMAPGGTEHQLKAMLETAHGRLWDATLVVLSAGWDLTGEVGAAGVPIVELDGAARVDPRRAARFRRLTRHVDVVHSSLWGANAFSRLAGIGLTPAVVVSERGVEDHRPARARAIDRLLTAATDAYIGNSPAVTEFIRTWHGLTLDDPRVVEIRNGIDTSIFRPRRSPGQGRARIVIVGRLIPDKRVDSVIEVLPRILQQTPVELVVVGDGPDRTRLVSLAEGLPVRFLGYLGKRAELAAVLRASSVLAMPSVSEGLPNAVIEARACGLRVVASDIPGIRPLEGPGVRLVRTDPDEWVEELVAAIRSGPLEPSDWLDYVRSFEQVAKDHLKVFEAAIDHSMRRRRT